ncbi:hypothetical protein MCEMSEM23_01678 [Rhabdaerophilaceae bacterium]
MKSFVAACVVMIMISFGAAFILDASYQKGVSQAYATTGVRL